MIILICGLGNPGSQYLKNRHNIGFLTIEYIAEHFNAMFSEVFKVFRVGCFKNNRHSYLHFLQTQYFYEFIRQCVGALKRFYNIDNGNIWIIHDDIDLEFGDIRLKKDGGHAGHNGLRSVDAHIGKDYHRVRIGVGRPEHKEDVSHYVLSNFSKSEDYQKMIEEAWEKLKPFVTPENSLPFD